MPEHFLDRIVQQLPPYEGPENCSSYLAQLDPALIDRYLAAAESDALVEIAAALNIGQLQAMSLHIDYVRALTLQTWATSTPRPSVMSKHRSPTPSMPPT